MGIIRRIRNVDSTKRDLKGSLMCKICQAKEILEGNNFVSDGHVCNTFCPVLQKLVDVGLKTF